MNVLAWSLVLGGCLLASSPQAEPALTVTVPISPGGELNVAEAVERLAKGAGLDMPRPAESLNLPIRGLAGALTRTLLEEFLGPDVSLTIRPESLTIALPAGRTASPEARAELQARIRDLAARVQHDARRSIRYGMRAMSSYRPNDPSRPTVCLVHGMNSSSGSFVYMIPLLEAAGYGVVVYDFPFNRDLDITAPAFVRDWKVFRQNAGETQPWAILTHSMGALLARFYVEGETGYEEDVSSLLLIAPPNHGSAVAGAQTVLQLVQNVQSANNRQAGALCAPERRHWRSGRRPAPG